jgi:hypothetical protein
MLRSYIILICLVTSSNNSHGQSFDSLTSKVFFNIDIEKRNKILVSEFDAKPELTAVKLTGWTMYPPTDVKGNLIPFFIYSFSQHPYFSPGIKKGRLILFTNKDSVQVIGMSLSISFDSKTAFDTTYQDIKKLYGGYSSKSIRRPNILEPIVITKFISRNKPNYVILTKDEDAEGFYIGIDYNYQGYEW